MLFHISVKGTKYVTTGSDENNIDLVVRNMFGLTVRKIMWDTTWTELKLNLPDEVESEDPEVQENYLEKIRSLGVEVYLVRPSTPLIGVKTFRRNN